MKTIVVVLGVLVSLAAAHVVFAQTSDGMISYEQKINLHRRLPPGQEARKAMIPEFRTTKHQLVFTEDASLYKPVIEDEEEPMGGGGGIQMRMRVPNEEVYINATSNAITTKREFMGKDYLIDDTLKISPWKLGTETKEILGYVCNMAYYIDESQPDRKLEVTAWYTNKLRPMLGPEQYGSLPGAVLAIDINNGDRVVVARKVEFRALKKNELKIPTSGQKITQAEYRKHVEETMKQMGGGNGRMIIRN
ncbi:MAG: GLPGLI family protein [Cytophagales bacterium]|nr:GLPGLI family protein [Cytophagales bacterium]